MLTILLSLAGLALAPLPSPQEALARPEAGARRPAAAQSAPGSAPQSTREPSAELVSAKRLLIQYDLTDVIGERSPLLPADEEASPLERLQQIQQAEHARDQHLARLARAIEVHVSPPFVEGLDQMKFGGSGLVLLGTAAHHTWVEGFLRLQRDVEGDLVDLSVRTVAGPRGVFDELLGMEGGNSAQITEADLERLVSALPGRPGLELVTAPRVLVYNRAPAVVSVLREVAYVKEYHLRHVQPGDVELVDPVVDVIQEGTLIEVVPICIEPGLYALDLSLQLSELVRPIPTRKVRVRAGDAEEFEVGVPEVLSIKMDSRLLMEDGAIMALLAASPAGSPDQGDRDLAILIQMDVITPEQVEFPDGEAAQRLPLPERKKK